MHDVETVRRPFLGILKVRFDLSMPYSRGGRLNGMQELAAWVACKTGTIPMRHPLATYLHDHLAGALVAINLLEALRDQHASEPLGQFAAGLLVEVEEDRAVLWRLAEQVGAGPSALKEATA